jgi:hypothetical protein
MTERKHLADRFHEMRTLTTKLEAFTAEARDVTNQYESALTTPLDVAFERVNPLPERVATLFNDLDKLSRELTGREPRWAGRAEPHPSTDHNRGAENDD